MRFTLASIGVELEGGINYKGLDAIRKRYFSERYGEGTDGSVNVHWKQIHNIELRFWSEKLQEVLDFIEYCFENGLEQNETCGNHVHLRIEPYYYYKLITYRSFWLAFKRKYTLHFRRSPKHLARLQNSYCYFRYDQRNIIKNLEGHGTRYCAINLLALHKRENTLEIRLLPFATSAQELNLDIMWLVKTLLQLLDKAKIKEEQTVKPELIPLCPTNCTIYLEGFDDNITIYRTSLGENKCAIPVYSLVEIG